MYTIYELAERLKCKVWEKGELKRIYLNEGYNTRKMRTKTYIWQDEKGDFKVSCYIDCPSQPWNWIICQKEIVVKEVEEKIYKALAETYFLPIHKTDSRVFRKGSLWSREEFMLFPSTYLSKDEVMQDFEEWGEDAEEYEIIAVSREDAQQESKIAWKNVKAQRDSDSSERSQEG